MPAAGDGSAIYDSGIIIEFLQDVAGTDRLLPQRGRALQGADASRLADGIMDASILVVYEGRFRRAAPHSARWLAHQRGKIMRGLAVFEAAPPDPEKTDSSRSGCPARSAISTGVSRWTGARPFQALSTWLDRFPARAGF